MEYYANDSETGKHRFDPALEANQHTAPRDGAGDAKVTFRASGGRIWAYKGKRARVFVMLVT